jgi:hypothetical protein
MQNEKKAPSGVQTAGGQVVSPVQEPRLDYTTLVAARDLLRQRLRNLNEANFGGRFNGQIAKVEHQVKHLHELVMKAQIAALALYEEAFPYEAPKSAEPVEGWCQDPWQLREVG